MNMISKLLSPAQVETWRKSRLPAFKKSGAGEYRGPCPIHNGKDANFSVNMNKAVWFCHSQCQRGGSILQLEMLLTGKSTSEALNEVCQLAGEPAPNGHGGLIELEAYAYVDEQGSPLFEQVRFWDSTQGKKTFQTRRCGPTGEWEWKRHSRKVLYRLPAVMKADLVHITEGEKDVHTLESFGWTATTNPWGLVRGRTNTPIVYAART